MCGANTEMMAFNTDMIRSRANIANAMVVAHELGHNFGLQHVSDTGVIMSARSSGSAAPAWALASRSSFDALVTVGEFSCLDNAATVTPDQGSIAPNCGN